MFETWRLKRLYSKKLAEEVKEKVAAQLRYEDAMNRPFTVAYMQDIVNAAASGMKLDITVTTKDGTKIEVKRKDDGSDGNKYTSDLY